MTDETVNERGKEDRGRVPATTPARPEDTATGQGYSCAGRWLIGADPRVISIVGPTASGKTALAIGLAGILKRKLGQECEIVNEDAYQVYRGMDIGTAKPTKEERSRVRHWLIDVADPEETMSVALFQRMARETIQLLLSRGVRPILVGGSGLYARAAVDDMRFPGHSDAVRESLWARERDEGPEALFRELERKDPEAAGDMDPHNPRRTIRALEVIAVTGKPYSASLPRYRYVIPTVQIGLDLPGDALDERVALRTRQMRDQGLVDEVRRLRPRLGFTASRALGYPQVEEFLDGNISEDEAFARIEQKTRRLARRQMSWFGRDPRIHWLPALSPDLLDRAFELVKRADSGTFDERDFADVTPTRHHLGQLAHAASSPDQPNSISRHPGQETGGRGSVPRPRG